MFTAVIFTASMIGLGMAFLITVDEVKGGKR